MSSNRISIRNLRPVVSFKFGKCVAWSVPILLIALTALSMTACGVDYDIGDTGPAGGIVFYDKGRVSDGWRYLEAWTADESGTYQWKTSKTGTPGTSTAIGSGYANTYAAMTGTEHPAAEVARNATHGEYDDWFLPSKDELNAIWENIVDDGDSNNSGVGGFASDFYWSSSELNNSYAWSQYFGYGRQFDYNKAGDHRVRVVRAF